MAEALWPILSAPEVLQSWDEVVLAAESVECPEPWLAGRVDCSVQWLD